MSSQAASMHGAVAAQGATVQRPNLGIASSVSALWIPDVPSTFSGKLYFIVGPGLGDTVNDFRILQEVASRYPNASLVVYLDARWRSLCPLVPVLTRATLHFHEAAPSGAGDAGTMEIPYHRTFQAILEEIEKDTATSPGFLALGGFKCPDQLARQESGLAMKARAIGLDLSSGGCRPFLPVSQKALEESRQFLSRQGLEPGGYIAVAPHTHPDKVWPRESWEEVLEGLDRALNLPVLMLGLPGNQELQGARIIPAIGLSLPVVAGLLVSAKAYVGLDSGLSHLAGCFDIPAVTLNPSGKFPPFLVEANSPYRWTILTPGIYGQAPIMPGVVMTVISAALSDVKPPACPVCEATPYVLSGKQEVILFLCRCGCLFRRATAEGARHEAGPVDQENSPLPNYQRELEALKRQLETESPLVTRSHLVPKPRRFRFDHWDPISVDPERIFDGWTGRDLWWTWDAAYRFFLKEGWAIVESSIRRDQAGGSETVIDITVSPRTTPATEGKLAIPWGSTSVTVDPSVYERWLAWSAFRNQDELEGLGWLLAQRGEREAGKAILKLAFRYAPRWRTLSRLMRVRWACRNSLAGSGAA